MGFQKSVLSKTKKKSLNDFRVEIFCKHYHAKAALATYVFKVGQSIDAKSGTKLWPEVYFKM